MPYASRRSFTIDSTIRARTTAGRSFAPDKSETENAPGLLRRLKVRPRRILLGTIPVLSQSSFAEQCTFGNSRALFKNSDQGTAHGRQLHWFQQVYSAPLVNYCFDRSNHMCRSSLTEAYTSSGRLASSASLRIWMDGCRAHAPGRDRQQFAPQDVLTKPVVVFPRVSPRDLLISKPRCIPCPDLATVKRTVFLNDLDEWSRLHENRLDSPCEPTAGFPRLHYSVSVTVGTNAADISVLVQFECPVLAQCELAFPLRFSSDLDVDHPSLLSGVYLHRQPVLDISSRRQTKKYLVVEGVTYLNELRKFVRRS